MTLAPGTRIGAYDITGPLGAGGMGASTAPPTARNWGDEIRRDATARAGAR